MMTNSDTRIMTDAGPDAVRIIGDVLKCNTFAVDGVLEEEGIIPVEISPDMLSGSSYITRDVVTDDGDSIKPSVEVTTDESDIQTPGSQTPTTLSSFSQRSTRSTPLTVSPTPPERIEARSHLRTPAASIEPQVGVVDSLPTPQPTSPGIPQPAINLDFESNAAYKRLLEWVVEVSRTTTFPHRRTFSFDMNSTQIALQLAYPGRPAYPGQEAFAGAFGVRSQDQQEQDRRTGAAGELFVSLPTLYFKNTL